MPRGKRKSELEKLNEELLSVQDAIHQYQDAVKTMKEKEKELAELIKQEEAKELMKLLDGRGMTFDDILSLLDDAPSNQDQEIA